MKTNYDQVSEFAIELTNARKKFPTFNSAHEGYSVLLEEVDELWDEVKQRNQSIEIMRKEAVQIGAMALAFIVEVCNG